MFCVVFGEFLIDVLGALIGIALENPIATCIIMVFWYILYKKGKEDREEYTWYN